MNATILVVDDNPTNLKLVSNVLEYEGHTILKATDAEEAQLIIARTPPDLILMDIALPGMDGLTLTRKLKADEKTRHIRIIALTAFAMKGDDKKAFDAGCDGYVTKPIDTRRLPQLVADQLRPAPAISPKHILLVEDNRINRKLLRAILEAEGHVVIEAVDGLEALTLGDPGQVEAIISDILMPNMDGYRLCYEVRRRERWRNMPFIFYTSTYTSDEDERLALDLGADAYLRKPASAAVISETLRKVLEKQNHPRPTRPFNETDVLKEYSERLVSKLEERNNQLLKQTAELEFEIAQRKKADDAKTRVEALLGRAQKMEALGTLAGGIAHDFNNIISAITGNAELALQDLPSDHPSRNSLNEITKATARARSVVNQILTFSRQQTSKRETVKLPPVIEEALQLLRVTLPPMIEIRTHFDPNAPAVAVDTSQVHQIIVNLCTNSKHAMNDQGTLDVGVSRVNVDSDLVRTTVDLHVGPYVRVDVTDSGCGMDKAMLDRIFDPFYTTKPIGEGTGLGLSVVHGIMIAHGGAVTVHSEPGKGTMFRLYFPVAADVPATSTASPTTSMPALRRGNGERILLVDDDKSLVYLITRMLERLGYHISGFSDARQALQAFLAAPTNFDLVIADWFMPGIPGLELARQMLQARPGMPIVIASGVNRADVADQAKVIGVHDVIPRPSTADEWSEALHRLLSGIKHL